MHSICLQQPARMGTVCVHPWCTPPPRSHYGVRFKSININSRGFTCTRSMAKPLLPSASASDEAQQTATPQPGWRRPLPPLPPPADPGLAAFAALIGSKRFLCTQCGKCCTGDGEVWISDDEAVRIADHLGVPLQRFLSAYTRGYSKAPGFRMLRSQISSEVWLLHGVLVTLLYVAVSLPPLLPCYGLMAASADDAFAPTASHMLPLADEGLHISASRQHVCSALCATAAVPHLPLVA
jgi:hypothetical protein